MHVVRGWHIVLGATLLLCVAHRSAAGTDGRVADAAMHRDTATVRSLISRKADVNAPQADGARALHWAAHWSDLAMADFLAQKLESAAAETWTA